MHRYGVVFHVWLSVLVSLGAAGWGRGAADRKPSGFDLFGPCTIPLAINEKNEVDSARIRQDLRSFIWSHWRQRRRGRAIVTDISLEESVPCTTEYIIEPDKSGAWHIDERWRCRKGRPRSGKSVITSVRRLAADSSGSRTKVAIPDDSDLPPRSYVLEFFDASGEFEGYR